MVVSDSGSGLCKRSLGMCSRQVPRTSSKWAAERGFGDGSEKEIFLSAPLELLNC